MSTLGIVLLALLGVVLVMIAGGLVVTARRWRAEARTLRAAVLAADQALATAHAADKGWDRATMEAAAREVAGERAGTEVRALHLVQVVDRPGTDEDEAVFRAVTTAGEHEVRLGRRGDAWVAR